MNLKKLAVLAIFVLLVGVGYIIKSSLNMDTQNTVVKTDINKIALVKTTPPTPKPTPVVVKKAAKPAYEVPRSTPASKKKFLEDTIAAITKVKSRLDKQYQMVYELSKKEQLTPKEEAIIAKLKKRYKVKGIPCLLKRLHTHPISVIIAQATLESGWGGSRFYREANNIFGVWSFNSKEPRMAAGTPREGKKTIYVKKYANLEASIEGYFGMMGRVGAYKKFRTARLHTDNPFKIIPYLDHYSELRHEYVKRLYFMIKHNKFYELDDPVYQPPGWNNIEPADPSYLKPKAEKPAAKVADKCKKDQLNIDNNESNSSQHFDLTATQPDQNRSSTKQEHNITLTNTTLQADINNSTQEQNQTSPVVDTNESNQSL